jgi:hypothetical protein
MGMIPGISKVPFVGDFLRASTSGMSNEELAGKIEGEIKKGVQEVKESLVHMEANLKSHFGDAIENQTQALSEIISHNTDVIVREVTDNAKMTRSAIADFREVVEANHKEAMAIAVEHLYETSYRQCLEYSTDIITKYRLYDMVLKNMLLERTSALQKLNKGCGDGYDIQLPDGVSNSSVGYSYCATNGGMTTFDVSAGGVVGTAECKEACDASPACSVYGMYGALDGVSITPVCQLISDCLTQADVTDVTYQTTSAGAIFCRKQSRTPEASCGDGYDILLPDGVSSTSGGYSYCATFGGMTTFPVSTGGVAGTTECKEACDASPTCSTYGMYGALDGVSITPVCRLISDCLTQADVTDVTYQTTNAGAIFCRKQEAPPTPAPTPALALLALKEADMLHGFLSGSGMGTVSDAQRLLACFMPTQYSTRSLLGKFVDKVRTRDDDSSDVDFDGTERWLALKLMLELLEASVMSVDLQDMQLAIVDHLDIGLRMEFAHGVGKQIDQAYAVLRKELHSAQAEVPFLNQLDEKVTVIEYGSGPAPVGAACRTSFTSTSGRKVKDWESRSSVSKADFSEISRAAVEDCRTMTSLNCVEATIWLSMVCEHKLTAIGYTWEWTSQWRWSPKSSVSGRGCGSQFPDAFRFQSDSDSVDTARSETWCPTAQHSGDGASTQYSTKQKVVAFASFYALEI